MSTKVEDLVEQISSDADEPEPQEPEMQPILDPKSLEREEFNQPQWACAACSFDNHGAIVECEMCGSKRPEDGWSVCHRAALSPASSRKINNAHMFCRYSSDLEGVLTNHSGS
eukprot:SAG11_NODE_2934_length_2828_cov_1.446684_4_plen_113_part_00